MSSTKDFDVKKTWNKPEIFILDIKKTQSGDTPDTPEGLGYDPVISP